MTAWAPTSGPARYGLSFGGPGSPATADSGLTALATPSQGAAQQNRPWSPSSPLFFFGVLGAVTFGFMAVSTSASVRVGHAVATLGGGVGSTK